MPRHAWLTALAGFVAVSAYGGVVTLITGWLRPTASMAQRLPFHSPVLPPDPHTACRAPCTGGSPSRSPPPARLRDPAAVAC